MEVGLVAKVSWASGNHWRTSEEGWEMSTVAWLPCLVGREWLTGKGTVSEHGPGSYCSGQRSGEGLSASGGFYVGKVECMDS